MIYLDYNATTPLCDEAREAMLPYLDRRFGNASSVHAAGREARAAVDDAREKLAASLRVRPHEIIFTSGGTESCNLAVLGLARWQRSEKLDGLKPSSFSDPLHVISNKAEHHAVLNAVEHLEKHEGFEVTWLNVSRDGIIDLDQLADSIRPETRLVSIMAANNETGVIQPLREISRVCRERGVLLHSDMVQAFGKMPVANCSKVEKPRGRTSNTVSCDPSTPLPSAQDECIDLSLVDAASFAAHKFYGPKGAGFLFLRSGLRIEPIMFGGAHENERRPGTENVPAIAGMAAAAEWTLRDQQSEQQRERQLRDELWTGISGSIPDAQQNGANAPRLANTLNTSLLGLDSETLLIALDLEGVCASSGSACMVGSVVASHVLLAMGLPMENARSAVRFSLGKWTTAEEIEAAGHAVRKIVERLQTRKSAYAVA